MSFLNPEYTVRPVDLVNFEVAKFQLNKWPDKVYIVSLQKHGVRPFWRCNCIAAENGQENCRHVRMVREYIDRGWPSINMFWLDLVGDINGMYLDFKPLRKEYEKVVSKLNRDDSLWLRELAGNKRKAPHRDKDSRRLTRTVRSGGSSRPRTRKK